MPVENFHVMPFVPDGECMGSGVHEIANLSARWIENASRFLEANGATFRASWGGPLERFETKFTSSNGAAIGTFYVNGIAAASTLYLGGIDPPSDDQVQTLFVESMRQVELVRAAASTATPFKEVFDAKARPLSAIVVWAPESISADDMEIVQELSTHFAAAYFMRANRQETLQ